MKITIDELIGAGWEIVEVISENEVVWKRERWLIKYDILKEEILDTYSEVIIPINLN